PPRRPSISSGARLRSRRAPTRSRGTSSPGRSCPEESYDVLFEITEEQEMLREVARRFVREEYGFARRRRLLESGAGHDPDLWRTFSEMGWLALPFADADGGLGGGAVELLLLMEAFGSGLVVEPYLGAVVLGGGAVAAAGSEA